MLLYNQCLVSVVLNGGYKTDDLPHTIRADIDVLQCLKKKLDEENATIILIDQIQKRIDFYCNYRYCDCEIPIDCKCSVYFDNLYANSDEQERARLDKELETLPINDECMKEDFRRLVAEEEDLQLKSWEQTKEIMRVKDKIPIWLKDVARKMVKKMDYLLWDWDSRLFGYL